MIERYTDKPLRRVIDKVLRELRDFALRAALRHLGRWAKISPLSVPLWITPEQALPFRKGLGKVKASLRDSARIVLATKSNRRKGDLP